MQIPQPPKHSILILTYNRADLIEARLNELKELYSDRDDVEIRVLENGGNDGTMLTLRDVSFQYRHESLRLNIRKIKENVGFGPGFNKLADSAKGEILYFVSNDVKIWGDFLTPVSENIDLNPHSIVCHELHNAPTGWNQFGGLMIPYPAGHFIACTKKLWTEVIGGFDERYVPHDYEDVDLGKAAQELEIALVGLPRLPITHIVAGSIGYNPKRMENTVLQRERFAKKWNLPNIPKRP